MAGLKTSITVTAQDRFSGAAKKIAEAGGKLGKHFEGLSRFPPHVRGWTPPKGDLPVGFLEREWKDALGAETQLVRLTQRTARKQRKKHPNMTLGQYRLSLPETLRNAQVVLSETGHWGRGTEDLVFFWVDRGDIYKATVSADTPRNVRLATFYDSSLEDLQRAMVRGKVLRDRR